MAHPAAGLHLTNFHGDFASHAKARASVLLPTPDALRPGNAAKLEVQAGSSPESPEAPVDKPLRRKRPRVDWAALRRHTLGCDVWACPCGGRRRVVAVVTSARTAEELLRNMGRWRPKEPLPAAQGPPQRQLVLD